jgi:hypothetical protein
MAYIQHCLIKAAIASGVSEYALAELVDQMQTGDWSGLEGIKGAEAQVASLKEYYEDNGVPYNSFTYLPTSASLLNRDETLKRAEGVVSPEFIESMKRLWNY